MTERKRLNSIEKLRQKADNLRTINLGSIDKDMNELDKEKPKNKTSSVLDENKEEDDVAIAAAVAEIEKELLAERRGSSTGLFIAILVAILAYFYRNMLADLPVVQWLLERKR
jgi:hypothetical protein